MPKDLIVVHHCLLNPSVRAEGASSKVAQAIPKIKKYLEGKEVIQLPCPELIFAGLNRPLKVKEDYDVSEYRALCQKIAQSLVGKEIKEIIGVNSSPSCGVTKVHTRKGKIDGSGILVEEIRKLFPEIKYQTYSQILDNPH